MNLKDVIHYYYGADCKISVKGANPKQGKVSTGIIKSIENPDLVVKPILRRLSDILPEEIESVRGITDPGDDPLSSGAHITDYLIGQGFDLFGLIDSGQAIDKKTL